MEMSGTLTKDLPWHCGGNTRGLLYIGKKYREMKKIMLAAGENSSGFTNKQSSQGGAFSGDLLDQKSKSPLFPGLWGGRGYTND